MNKLILLVLTEKDVQALPGFIERLKRLPKKREGIWVLHNPHLGVSDTAVETGYQKQIDEFNAQIKAATAREDFNAAGTYKEQRDAVVMQRDLAVRDGWQKMDPAARQAQYDTLFRGLDQSVAQNILVTTVREVYQPAQAFELLKAQQAQWPGPLVHGEYVIGWPGSLLPEEAVVDPLTHPNATLTQNRLPAPDPKPAAPKPKRETFITLQRKARELGLYRDGMTFNEMKDAIAATEAGADQKAA